MKIGIGGIVHVFIQSEYHVHNWSVLSLSIRDDGLFFGKGGKISYEPELGFVLRIAFLHKQENLILATCHGHHILITQVHIVPCLPCELGRGKEPVIIVDAFLNDPAVFFVSDEQRDGMSL